MNLLPVDGQPGLYRDTKSNAIVNNNNNEYENYIKQRNARKNKYAKIEEIEDELHQIKSDLFEIKSILKSFIDK
jgi:hypothetical protein